MNATERIWHMGECVPAECVGAQRIDGIRQGGCVPCFCGHPLEAHYQDREDEGCRSCNAERIAGGEERPCHRFRSVMTGEEGVRR